MVAVGTEAVGIAVALVLNCLRYQFEIDVTVAR